MITQKVYTNDLEGRIDPYFYKSEFIKIENKLRQLKLTRIKDIAPNIKNGSTPKGGIFEQEGVPYFRSQDFSLFDFEQKQFIKAEFHKKLSRSAIKASDVLLAVVGATLGVVGYVPEKIKEGNINQNVARIRISDKKVNPKYLAIFLSSEIGQKLILRNATITAQPYLNNQRLGNIKVPLVPLKTQNKIADIIQKAYLAKEKKLKQADELLNSIDEYVREQLGMDYSEPKEEKIYTVNSQDLKGNRQDPYYYNSKFVKAFENLSSTKHKILNLGQLMIDMSGGATPKVDGDFYADEESGIPFLRVQNITKEGISLDDVKYIKKSVHNTALKRSQLRTNDLVFTITGRIGSVAVVPNNFIGNINQHSVRIQLKDKLGGRKISPIYIATFLNSSIGQQITIRGITGGTRPALDYEYIKTLPIPLPDIKTQQNIAQEFSNRLSEAEKLRNEASELLKKAKKKVEKLILKDKNGNS